MPSARGSFPRIAPRRPQAGKPRSRRYRCVISWLGFLLLRHSEDKPRRLGLTMAARISLGPRSRLALCRSGFWEKLTRDHEWMNDKQEEIMHMRQWDFRFLV